MKGLLVRVAADQSEGGGRWNGPVDSTCGVFCYVPIPESVAIHENHARPYSLAEPSLSRFGLSIPAHLKMQRMHLDPDFDHLTYGDQGERGNQIRNKLRTGDFIAFYAGLRDLNPPGKLVYALIGLYHIEEIVPACQVPCDRWHENAHTRRCLGAKASDVVVRACRQQSGRLDRSISIGSYREKAYRVLPKLLDQWGGLGVKNGYLQRSARLPEFLDPERFLAWFDSQSIQLVAKNF